MTSSAYSSVAAEQDLAGFEYPESPARQRRSSNPDTGMSCEEGRASFVVTLGDVDDVEDAAQVTIGRAADVVPGQRR